MLELSKKEQVYFKICDSVLFYELFKGHLNWSLSDISKHSGVTRSLIYYYMGKEKEQILHEAVRFMLELFFNTNQEKSLGVEERMVMVLTQTRQMPHIFLYYSSERIKDTENGKIIRDAEEVLFTYMEKELQIDRKKVLKLFLMELGACAFQLEPEAARDFFKF
jgi:AcrR family transcriptional regulator